jgi:hypothetical protein
MKKLALTLAFIATTAHSAYWKDVGISLMGPVRVDVLSIEEVRGTRTAWVMWNHRKDPQPPGSTMMRYQFNCKDKKASSLQYVTYSKENLGGIVTTIQWRNDKPLNLRLWAYSVPMQAFATVCSPNIAKQVKAMSQAVGWLQVVQGNEYVISIDLSSITTEGAYRKAWSLWQSPELDATTSSKKTSESSKQLTLYNCEEKSIAGRRMLIYADRFGEGKVLMDDIAPKDKFNFINVIPPDRGPDEWPYVGTLLEDLGIMLKVVCSYPIK